MAELRSICVYCGSNPGGDPRYREAAETLGRAMAQTGIRLVYGGGSVGLMGTLADSVLDHGGFVTGVIPDFLVNREHMLARAQEGQPASSRHTAQATRASRASEITGPPAPDARGR